MTKDPPKSIRSNILNLYQNNFNSTKQDKAFYESNNKSHIWTQFLMSLSLFHFIIRERKRFGPIGWNIIYDFNESDFRISMK